MKQEEQQDEENKRRLLLPQGKVLIIIKGMSTPTPRDLRLSCAIEPVWTIPTLLGLRHSQYRQVQVRRCWRLQAARTLSFSPDHRLFLPWGFNVQQGHSAILLVSNETLTGCWQPSGYELPQPQRCRIHKVLFLSRIRRTSLWLGFLLQMRMGRPTLGPAAQRALSTAPRSAAAAIEGRAVCALTCRIPQPPWHRCMRLRRAPMRT